jgi:hypothetical protein
LRRIDSREVDITVKAVQARKVRQLYAMLDGTSKKPRYPNLFGVDDGRRAKAAGMGISETDLVTNGRRVTHRVQWRFLPGAFIVRAFKLR